MSDPTTRDDESLLRARAKLLAAPARAPASGNGEDELLVVLVGQARYALPLARLAGVVTLQQVTPLPGAPPFVDGLSHVQGRTLTVVSLGVLLSHPPAPARLGVLIDVAGESFAFGVSGLEGVRAMWDAAEHGVPAAVSAEARRVIRAVGPGGVCLVDLDQLIDDVLTGDAARPGSEP